MRASIQLNLPILCYLQTLEPCFYHQFEKSKYKSKREKQICIYGYKAYYSFIPTTSLLCSFLDSQSFCNFFPPELDSRRIFKNGSFLSIWLNLVKLVLLLQFLFLVK